MGRQNLTRHDCSETRMLLGAARNSKICALTKIRAREIFSGAF